MPHGITQCYLPPGKGDIPALTAAEAGTRLSDPGGMQGLVDLVVVVVVRHDKMQADNLKQKGNTLCKRNKQL